MTVPIRTDRVARKEHHCIRGDTIEPGEHYADEAYPPWTQIADDVDDDGRPVGGPSGIWWHDRMHLSPGRAGHESLRGPDPRVGRGHPA